MIFRNILEDYRSPIHKLMGYKDPEVIISMFESFWEKLLYAVEMRNYTKIDAPSLDNINLSDRDQVAFLNIQHFTKSKSSMPSSMYKVKIDELYVYLSNFNLIQNSDFRIAAFAVSEMQFMVIPNLNTKNPNDIISSLKQYRKTVLHEFTHLVQNSIKDIFRKFRSYENEAIEHEAFMVSILEEFYSQLRTLKENPRAIPNNLFFRSGKYLDFCKLFYAATTNPKTANVKILWSLIKYHKIPKAYKFFSEEFAKFGGKPTDTDETIKTINSLINRSIKKYNTPFSFKNEDIQSYRESDSVNDF
jgi:hypothetical protein